MQSGMPVYTSIEFVVVVDVLLLLVVVVVVVVDVDIVGCVGAGSLGYCVDSSLIDVDVVVLILFVDILSMDVNVVFDEANASVVVGNIVEMDVVVNSGASVKKVLHVDSAAGVVFVLEVLDTIGGTIVVVKLFTYVVKLFVSDPDGVVSAICTISVVEVSVTVLKSVVSKLVTGIMVGISTVVNDSVTVDVCT